jgi:hypothetical protein
VRARGDRHEPGLRARKEIGAPVGCELDPLLRAFELRLLLKVDDRTLAVVGVGRR